MIYEWLIVLIFMHKLICQCRAKIPIKNQSPKEFRNTSGLKLKLFRRISSMGLPTILISDTDMRGPSNLKLRRIFCLFKNFRIFSYCKLFPFLSSSSPWPQLSGYTSYRKPIKHCLEFCQLSVWPQELSALSSPSKPWIFKTSTKL